MDPRKNLHAAFRWLLLCSTGYLLYYAMCNDESSQGKQANKLGFPGSVGKFDRNSTDVKHQRLIRQNLTTPTNISIYNNPNKLGFPVLVGKFDRNSTDVKHQRLIRQNSTTPTNLSIYNNPNKLGFPGSVGKFDRNSTNVKHQRLIRQNSTTPKNVSIYNNPNKLGFPGLVGKFDRNSIDVKHHRLIWQNFTTPTSRTIYLYGAYYDDRPLHNGKRFLQVLAVGALVSSPVYAVMWTKNTYKTNTSSLCTVMKNGAGYYHPKFKYDQFFYSCEVKIDAIPEYVSLTFNDNTLQSNLLSVHVPEKKRKHKFAICVGTAYGHINPYQIIEWVEANKYFGVTSISVYPCKVSESNMRIFRQFEKEGIMRVSHTPSPIGDRGWARQMTSSPISFNDCMLRQMYSTDYIIPLDLDEIITPKKKARNYHSLRKEIDLYYGFKEPLPAYVFKMAYFFTTCAHQRTTNSAHTMNMIRFTKKLPSNGNDKSFVDPRQCLSVFNHFCLLFFKDFSGPRNRRIVRDLGEVNHYRVAKSDELCKSFDEEGIIDLHLKNEFANDILIQYNKTVSKFRELKLLPYSHRNI